MKVELEKTYPLPVPAEQAWALLQDMEAVARCMPGGQIDETLGEDRYKGSVAVKVGPVSARFNGELQVLNQDPANRQLDLHAKGTDTKGSSSANMELTAAIREGDSADTSVLAGNAAVIVNGKLANFGARMFNQVADQVLDRFVAGFAEEAARRAPASESAQTPADSAAVADTRAEAPRELNGLALLWQVLVGFIRSLFGGGKQAGKG